MNLLVEPFRKDNTRLRLAEAGRRIETRPDYGGGSIVNLMASIESAFGAERRYAPLRGGALDALAAARNVVLIVVDGLGHMQLERDGAGGTLAAHLRGAMTSVFPSTTASAVTAFMTGLAPAQHGLTGWHMYLREIGSVVAILPLKTRLGGSLLADLGVPVASLFDHGPVFDRFRASSFAVSPEWIVRSDFNSAHAGRASRAGYRTLEDMFATARNIVRGGRGRQFVYAYYPELDSVGHMHGIGSDVARSELARIDRAFERFLEEIRGTDTAVILTADHGFIDTKPEDVIDLADHPDLSDTLMLPLCGEPRVAYCYVHPGRTRDFEQYVESELGRCASLFASEELVAQGLFGPGPVHPRLFDRIGHYTLVMRDGCVLRDVLPGEQRHPQVGVHGGTTAQEMLVPLVVAHA